MKKTLLTIPIALSIGIGLLTSCGQKKEQTAASADSLQTKKPLNITEIVALGRVEPAGEITALAPEVSGLVDKVLVQEGDTLQAGTPILTLSSQVKDAEINFAVSRLNGKRTQVEADKASLASAQIELANRQSLLNRIEKLKSQGAETQQTLDDTKKDLLKQQKEVDRLSKVIATSQSAIQELEKEIVLRKTERDQLTVKAPKAGILLSLETRPGENVSITKSFAEFAPLGAKLFVCEVDELYADKVTLQQTAILRNQGATQTLAQGKVVYLAPYLSKKSLISDAAGDAEDRRVRKVKILLSPDCPLLYNARLEAVISLPKAQ